MQEVVDRGALAQELRIGDGRERNAVPRLGRRILDERLQPARGSDGNGALRDEHLGAIQRAPDHDRKLLASRATLRSRAACFALLEGGF